MKKITFLKLGDVILSLLINLWITNNKKNETF
jgi:hypothetical protein